MAIEKKSSWIFQTGESEKSRQIDRGFGKLIFHFANLILQTRILQAKSPVQTWKKSSWIFQTGELEKSSADR